MGITYKSTAYAQGDPFPVRIRKMAQKLGVPVDMGDNVYRVMWNILANQDWSFGTAQPSRNIANQIVTLDSTPRQGDTLNMLFLKFAQRTGYVIVPLTGGVAGPAQNQVFQEILDPGNTPGGGGGGTGIFYTLTYTNDYGTITGTNPQTVEGNLDGTPVTAATVLSLSFDQWSDGVTDNPRTDTAISGDINVSAQWNVVEYVGGPIVDFEDVAEGVDIADQINGVGWASPIYRTNDNSGVGAVDDFSEYSLAASVDGLDGGTGWPEPWVAVLGGSGSAVISADATRGNRAEIRDACIVRKIPFGDGTDWLRIRLLIRVTLQDPGANISGQYMSFGVCEGSASPYHPTGSVTKSIGMVCPTNSWNRNGGTDMFSTGSWRANYRVGTTDVNGSNLGYRGTKIMDLLHQRSTFCIDIYKGAPTSYVRFIAPGAAFGVYDVPQEVYDTRIGYGSFLYSGSSDTGTLALTATCDTCDHIYAYYSNTAYSMTLDEIYVVKMDGEIV